MLNSRREIAGHLRERSQHEISDGVAMQPVGAAESMLQELGQNRRLSECRQAVADVARGKDAEVAPKLSRASTIVRHRDDSRQMFSDGIGIREASSPEGDTEALEHDRKAGAAADRDDAGPVKRIQSELSGQEPFL
jgi:hypothetical protein